MTTLVSKFIRHVLTDRDNTTYDTGRVTGVISVLSMVAFQGWSMHSGQKFDPLPFGTGLAAVIGSVGLYLMGDSKSDPKLRVQPESIS